MKILITGGAGFQGSHLTEFLLRIGHQISVLNTYSEKSVFNLAAVLDKINLIWGSITDKELVDKSVRGHEAVIHMAARINVDESLKDPLAFFYSNILGAYNILEAVKNYGSRLIFVSTCEVYGDGHDLKDGELLDESAELKPNSPYAASKASADRICYAYFRSFGLDVTIVRPFNIYGERQKSGLFGALIPILTAKALKGENLTVFGDGSATRDYTHVSDIVRAYNLILENSSLKGKTINFASGRNAKIKEIAEYIAKKFGVRVVHGPSRPGEVMRFPADISFARSLGYVPKINIWEGIDRYLEWAKLNLK
ncbi:MAG: NAD-dependent epimerase/dehydratase family protein [Candidatus Niyogibacteria bacterium]|nr:NAD-dependent epimerase/dehydratase family protein [Candidatus Niyogibacteria bacterium]